MIKLKIDFCQEPGNVALEGEVRDKLVSSTHFASRDGLELVKKILTKHKLTLENIDKIYAPQFCDNGSYTGHRIGISIANALNFAIGNNKILTPKYGKNPQITWRKK